MDVQKMVYVYLAVCVSMIIFNLVYVSIYKRGSKTTRKGGRKFSSAVKNAVLALEDKDSEERTVSEEHIEWLSKKCKNIWNFVSLDETLTALANEHQDAVDEYLSQIRNVFITLPVYLKHSDDISQTHYAYMVEKYKVVHQNPIKEIMQFMLEMVHSHNLYCRQNALRVLYDSGDVESVVSAIGIISESSVFHHEKLLIDGLLSFTGDMEALINALIENRKNYKLSIQLVILNFIRFSSGNHSEYFYDIMVNDKNEDELRFCALRYFAKYHYEPAENELKKFAEHPDKQRWEYASIAASALATYPGADTIRILKGCLGHYKWYIRYNAAVSLEKLNVSYIELADILDGNDRYAREIIQFQMDMNQMKKDQTEAKKC